VIAILKENSDLFDKAFGQFRDAASPSERAWLSKKYKHNDDKPPESLQDLLAQLTVDSERLKSRKFTEYYNRVFRLESPLRHFAIVVDSAISLAPEPAGSFAGLGCKLWFQ
jgi:hypothetical protein